MSPTAVRLHRAGRTYEGPPEVEALHPADIRIGGGEGVAIVGPSGSGKSTLLHLMGALDRPTTGRVEIAGVDTATLGDAALSRLRARTLGFVFQRFHLVEHRSALDNVADGLRPRRWRRPERTAAAETALDRVGLGHRGHHSPAQLSGGEQQRVAVARALAGSPRLVLADEPTGNLDTATGRVVLSLLDDVRRDGTTVVVITHDRAVAASLPRVVTLKDGRIDRDEMPDGHRAQPRP